MTPYPRWRYFLSYAPPPAWVPSLVGVFDAERAQIDSAVTHAERMESDDVLAVVSAGLSDLGFQVESGKKKTSKLPRPVFFGDEGTFLRTYEIQRARLSGLDASPTVDSLWDLLKVACIVEGDGAPSGYLVVASTPGRWRKAEVAELYAGPPGMARTWWTGDLLSRWGEVVALAAGWAVAPDH